jgi:hypothetical protein
MDERSRACAEVVDVILTDAKNEIYKATKYLSEKLTVKATRKRYKYNKGKIDHRLKHLEIILTIGKPNYEERDFIKCRKIIKEPFPVKAVMIKVLPHN